MGLARAEWIRFRKRVSIQVIVLAVPVLAGFFFLAGYASIEGHSPPFDEAAYRAEMIACCLEGVPPEDLEIILAEMVAQERLAREQHDGQVDLMRSKHTFPQSLVTLLGNGSFLFLALILLTATTIGDEFGWGTVRTALLASSNRRRMIIVRLVALALVAVLTTITFLVLGVVLPLMLQVSGAALPGAPPVDPAGLVAQVFGVLLVAFVVIGFAALATLLVRSGSLTLVVALVYVAIEAAILVLLSRNESFQGGGQNEWLLDIFPVHAISTLTTVTSQVASGLPNYFGEGSPLAGDAIARDLASVRVAVIALLVVGVLLQTLAVRRFSRMDIVE